MRITAVTLLLLLTLGWSHGHQSPALAADPGLIAAYGFNEGSGAGASDASGNGHTGTISGATWTAQGKFGGALAFDGVVAG